MQMSVRPNGRMWVSVQGDADAVWAFHDYLKGLPPKDDWVLPDGWVRGERGEFSYWVGVDRHYIGSTGDPGVFRFGVASSLLEGAALVRGTTERQVEKMKELQGLVERIHKVAGC